MVYMQNTQEYLFTLFYTSKEIFKLLLSLLNIVAITCLLYGVSTLKLKAFKYLLHFKSY